MKRTLTILSALIMLFSCLAVPTSAASSRDYPISESYYRNNPYRGTTLNVYNWGEYISDGSEGTVNVNREFERLTGIKINYTNFDSNEDMYAKLKSGGAAYDVIIPSDYMIHRLNQEHLLLKLNYKNIPNFRYIDPKYQNLYYDPHNEYTVAYNVGYVALIYNKKMVKQKPDSWGVLWDKQYKGKLLMFNNPRDAFGIAQSLLGQNYNNTDPSQWEQAYRKLVEQKPLVRSYAMDEVFNIMEGGDAALAPYYVGDFFTMHDNNPDLGIAFPKEGGNIFVDAMCIPKTAQNKGAAELYINFMEEPRIALANAETICYATPNMVVRNLDDYSFKGNSILYPPDSVMKNYQYFHNLPESTQTLMSTYWSDLKINGNRNTSVYVGLGCFAALFLALGIHSLVRRRRREKYYD